MATILIVEDNKMNRDMLATRLRRSGYEVLMADDGEQGVAAAKRERPALILMDMSLPGLNGWEATRLLKSSPETSAIPVIALTAHAIASDRDQAIAAGCDDYDTKPVDLARLIGKMSQWVKPGIAAAPGEEAAPAGPAASALDIINSSPTTAVKILLVEDNEMNRDMLSRRLLKRGYGVIIAIDGEQGVALAKTERPDLILMDLSLPGLDGMEATLLLKAMPDLASVPIIALTAHAMAGDREKAIAAGCDDYDTKPVEIDRLVGKIEQCLERARARTTESE